LWVSLIAIVAIVVTKFHPTHSPSASFPHVIQRNVG
jgi:hypothetical protein